MRGLFVGVERMDGDRQSDGLKRDVRRALHADQFAVELPQPEGQGQGRSEGALSF